MILLRCDKFSLKRWIYFSRLGRRRWRLVASTPNVRIQHRSLRSVHQPIFDAASPQRNGGVSKTRRQRRRQISIDELLCRNRPWPGFNVIKLFSSLLALLKSKLVNLKFFEMRRSLPKWSTSKGMLKAMQTISITDWIICQLQRFWLSLLRVLGHFVKQQKWVAFS